MKVVLINGPLDVSKEVGILLCQNAANGPWVLDEFGIELRERCHGAYRLMERVRPVPNVEMVVPRRHDHFETSMDIATEEFEGKTPREAYLAFYQYWVLPACGADALGRWLVRRVQFYVGQQMRAFPPSQRTRGMIVVDAGTVEECLPVVEAFGKANCTAIQVGNSRLDGLGIDVVSLPNLEGIPLNQIRMAAPGLFIELPPPKEIVIAT